MRAIAVNAFRTAPELTELPKPTPGPGEILVHVGAASVNPLDWKIVDGAYDGKVAHTFPLVVGVDGAGIVEGLGAGATRFKVGDAVFGQFIHPPFGVGTYAEYLTAPETLELAPIPRGVYTAQAAAVPTAGMTALVALDLLGLKKGQTVAIFGAKGGIGSFATQLASNQGILVIALGRGDHGTFLRKLGAFEYRDSGRLGYQDEFRFAYPKGVDAVLDLSHRGAEMDETMALVRDGGRFASPLLPAGPPTPADRGITKIPVHLTASRSFLDRLTAEIVTGRLRVPVEAQVPLAEAPAALETNRQGATRGKTVILV